MIQFLTITHTLGKYMTFFAFTTPLYSTDKFFEKFSVLFSRREKITHSLVSSIRLEKNSPVFVPAHQRNCGNVIFSRLSVCHSVAEREGTMWPLPMMHWTSPYSISSFVQELSWPSPFVQGSTWPGPHRSLLVTSGGQDWGPVQTSSLEDLTPASDTWRPRLETCWSLFTWTPTLPVLRSGGWILRHVGRTNGMVRILLENAFFL